MSEFIYLIQFVLLMNFKHLLVRVKYPVLGVLFGLIIVSIIISFFDGVIEIFKLMGGSNYLNFFLMGFLTPIGVFTPFTAAFFINTNFENIILSVLLAGVGAVCCDSIIFYLLKKFYKGSKVDLINLNGFFKENFFGRKLVDYFSFAFIGWIMSIPSKEGVGERVVRIISKMNALELFLLSFIVNTFMISSFVIVKLLLQVA